MSPGFDTSHVSPSDAALTLRSFPRRFRAELTLPEEAPRPDDVMHRRPRAGGLSATEHAAWVATALEQIGAALARILIEHDPSVELPPVDVDPPVPGGDRSVDDVIAQLADLAERLATRIAGASGAEWTRPGYVVGPGGADRGRVTALDVARLAVRIGVEHLGAIERTVAEVSRELDSRS